MWIASVSGETANVIMWAMREFEKPMKALANRRRLAILVFLKKSKEETVSDIAKAIHLSFKSTSRHLAVLAAADVVEREQRQLQVFYRLGEGAHASAKAVIKLL